MHAFVWSHKDDLDLFLIEIFGYPETKNKGKNWELMKNLDVWAAFAWLILGDFNELIESRDKWSVIPH